MKENLTEKLKSFGWKIYLLSNNQAELRTTTEGGVVFSLTVSPFTWNVYKACLNNIDIDDEVIVRWLNDKDYQNWFGNLRNAYNDMENFKNKLIEQTNEQVQTNIRKEQTEGFYRLVC